MRLLVTGDRMWRDTALLWRALDAFAATHDLTTIVEGCALGADAAAEFWANAHLIELDHHPADWERLGKAAGIIRNVEMLNTRPEHVLAFHADLEASRGTRHMVKIAGNAHVPVTLFPLSGTPPWWFE